MATRRNPLLNNFDDSQKSTTDEQIIKNESVSVPNDALSEKIADREAKVKKYLDALVNGDAISILFIQDNLAETAKEALLELEQLLRSSNISESKEELDELRSSCNQLREKVSELKPTYDELSRQKEELTEEVADLLKRKNDLTNTIDHELIEYQSKKEKEIDQELENKKREGLIKIKEELEQSIAAKKAEIEALDKTTADLTEAINNLSKRYNDILLEIKKYLKEEYEVTWEQISQNSALYTVRADKYGEFLEDLINVYARKMNVSYEEARDEFLAKSPDLFAIAQRVKVNLNGWEPMRIRAENSYSIKKSLEAVRLPVYKFVDNKPNLSQTAISNIRLLQRELELETIALEEKAKRVIAENKLKRVMNILVPLLPEDINLEEILSKSADNNDISSFIK